MRSRLIALLVILAALAAFLGALRQEPEADPRSQPGPPSSGAKEVAPTNGPPEPVAIDREVPEAAVSNPSAISVTAPVPSPADAGPAPKEGVELIGEVRWRDTGEPVGGMKALLYIDGVFRASQEHDGAHYTFTGLKPGLASVVVMPSPQGLVFARADIPIVAASGTLKVDIVVDRGATLEGVVLEETGVPVKEVWVFLSHRFHNFPSPDPSTPVLDPPDSRGISDSLTTDAEGKFRFENLRPCRRDPLSESGRRDETYWLSVNERTHETPEIERFTLSEGETRHIEIRLKKLPAPPIVSGLVLDPAGRPVAGASVGVYGAWELPEKGSGGSHCSSGTGVDEDGAFEFALRMQSDDFHEGKLIARYWLCGTADGYAPTFVPVEVVLGQATRDIRIALDPGKAIRGVVCSAEGTPVADAEVELEFRGNPREFDYKTRADALGKFEFPHVRDVDYHVEARAPGFHPSPMNFEVHGGDESVKVALKPRAKGEPEKQEVSPGDPGFSDD